MVLPSIQASCNQGTVAKVDSKLGSPGNSGSAKDIAV